MMRFVIVIIYILTIVALLMTVVLCVTHLINKRTLHNLCYLLKFRKLEMPCHKALIHPAAWHWCCR